MCVHCSTRYVHDNNICKIFPSRRNESVLRRDRNDMRSSAARHITRTRFRGTCFPRPTDGRRHCKQFFFPLTVGGDDETTTTTDGREFMPLTTGAHLALPLRVVFINLTPLPLTHYILYYSLLVCAGPIVFFQFRTFIIYIYVYKTRNNEKRPTPVLSS